MNVILHLLLSIANKVASESEERNAHCWFKGVARLFSVCSMCVQMDKILVVKCAQCFNFVSVLYFYFLFFTVVLLKRTK